MANIQYYHYIYYTMLHNVITSCILYNSFIAIKVKNAGGHCKGIDN